MKFILLITRGILLDRQMRRKTMFFAMLAALVMLFGGLTFLAAMLRNEPLYFMLFWAACGWLTILAFLLAVYDMLVLRGEAARERRKLKSDIFGPDEEEKP